MTAICKRRPEPWLADELERSRTYLHSAGRDGARASLDEEDLSDLDLTGAVLSQAWL